jgi:hypothetical protein
VDLATRTNDVIQALTNGDGYVIIRQLLPPDIVNSAHSIITAANLPSRLLRRLLFRHEREQQSPPVRTFDLVTRSPHLDILLNVSVEREPNVARSIRTQSSPLLLRMMMPRTSHKGCTLTTPTVHTHPS